MITQVDDVTTIANPNWQLSNRQFGYVAQGADDIIMCIFNIINIRKGEMPLDMTQGSLIYTFLDKPASIILPGITAECIDAIGQQEPRVRVQTVTYLFNSGDGSIVFTINMKVIATSEFINFSFPISAPNSNGIRTLGQ